MLPGRETPSKHEVLMPFPALWCTSPYIYVHSYASLEVYLGVGAGITGETSCTGGTSRSGVLLQRFIV